MARVNNVLGTIGRTPAIRLNRLAPAKVNLYVKAEAFNPMGSVKDRLALGVIEHAEQTGALRPGQTVIEATSGNTGLGLAMVCAQKGYPLVVVMSENFSIERRKMMRFLGAKVVLTPAALKGSGMLSKAEELAAAHGWFLARQFENEANADVHSRTTAREILSDFADGLDYWVTGYGTGGTLKGVARVLKAEHPATLVVVCEPDNAQILGSGIPQPRNPDGSTSESHPLFRPHLMQGWSPDFIPKLTEDAVASGLIDRLIGINGERAMQCARDLARQEGIFTGISGGATLAGALTVCETAHDGATVLCMLPDTGERYLSTTLFEDVSAEMDDDEIAISISTPGARFDQPPPRPAKAVAAPAAASPEAQAFVAAALADANQPVIMFALEWCEFCWSVRKMFARAQIPYRSVDLDSVEYQSGNRGGEIRAALAEQTGLNTIPLIFVGGEFIGGATETFDAWRAGELQSRLEACGVRFDRELQLDPYKLLPAWLHPR